MMDLIVMEWIDGTGRIRYGVDDTTGRRLQVGHYLSLKTAPKFLNPDSKHDAWLWHTVKFRTKRKALRAGRKAKRRHQRRTWTVT